MSTTPVTIRLATHEDLDIILHADPELYDNPVRADRTIEFLADPRHHLALAFAGDVVVGTASAIHYVHPDKEPTLFILEVAVSPATQGKGIGRGLVAYLLERGRALGCVDAWIATEQDNVAARRAYVAAGGVEAADPFVLIEYDLRVIAHIAQEKDQSS